MRLWEPGATARLLVLLALLFGFVGVCWWFMMRMPGGTFPGPLPPLSKAEAVLSKELRRGVEQLATVIGPRNVSQPVAFRAAADFIETSLREANLPVTRHTFTAQGVTCANLAAEIAGTARVEEIVVVGAHYDSCYNTPGANDNASGVAVMLALARQLASSKPARTLRWVAFANEEPPFFKAQEMGSLVYARHCRQRGDRIVAMLSLETVGYYTDTPGSQRYPFPLGLFYPSRGNFIAFVSRTTDAGLVRRCLACFRRHAQFPSEGAALPGMLPGIDWSDHWAFWQAGYPALMVTDTAPFRFTEYHTERDTPDRVEYDRMARVVTGLAKVVEELANR